MAWFHFDRQEEPPTEQDRRQAQRRALWDAYEGRRSAFPPDAIRLRQEGASDAFPEQVYLLAREEQAFCLLPELDSASASEQALARAQVQRYPDGRLHLTRDAPQPQPQAYQGLLAVYPIVPVSFTLALDGGAPARFTAPNRPHTAAFLEKHLPALKMRGVYDIVDEPPEARPIFCEQGGGLLPDRTRLSVWREGDTLSFLVQTKNSYYSTAQDVRFGTLPLAAVERFEPGGDIDYETRVTGGQVTVDRRAAFWAGWEHPLNLNPHGRAIEAAVSTEPIRTERVENDKRFVELRVRLQGRRFRLRLSYESLAVFDALIPEKSLENLPGEREPTVAEQIEILANVHERGYLTPEEFAAAKAKLLARL